jgi:hypothetical protein
MLAGGAGAQAQPIAGDARIAKIYELPALTAARAAEPPAQGAEGMTDPDQGHGDKGGPAVVAQMIRAFVKPALLANEDVQPLGERWLVLLGRAEQHAWLDRYLATARKQRDEVFTLDCEVYAMPEKVFTETVAPALAPPGKAAAGGPVLLAPGEGTDAFRAALKGDARCEAVASPKLVVRPLMPAQVSQVQQTAYVRDFEIEVAKASFLANPIVDVVRDGVSIEAAATLLQEGTMGVSLQMSVCDLQRPIREFTTTLAGSTLPVTIQLPKVQTTQARAAVELQRGHTIVLPLPPLAGKRHVLLLKLQ